MMEQLPTSKSRDGDVTEPSKSRRTPPRFQRAQFIRPSMRHQQPISSRMNKLKLNLQQNERDSVASNKKPAKGYRLDINMIREEAEGICKEHEKCQSKDDSGEKSGETFPSGCSGVTADVRKPRKRAMRSKRRIVSVEMKKNFQALGGVTSELILPLNKNLSCQKVLDVDSLSVTEEENADD